MPSDVRSFWNFFFGTVGTAAMVALTRPDLSGMTATHWVWAGTFFLVCGLLALGLLVVAGKHLRAFELSSLSYWEVVVAMLLGAAVFGEAVSPLAAAGAALIVAASVIPLVMSRLLRPRHRPTCRAPGQRDGRRAGRSELERDRLNVAVAPPAGTRGAGRGPAPGRRPPRANAAPAARRGGRDRRRHSARW